VVGLTSILDCGQFSSVQASWLV